MVGSKRAGERGAPRIGGFLQPAAAGFGIAEKYVALARLFAVRIDLAQPLAKLPDQRGLACFTLTRGGDAIGERDGGQFRRAAQQIQHAVAPSGTSTSAISTGPRELLRGAVSAPPGGGEQAALHLQHRVGVFRRGDASIGEVAVQFGELRAMQRDRRLLPAARGCGAAQRQGQRRKGDRRQQDDGEPDHDFSRSARRCRSASLSGAGAAGRRRRAISTAAMPASSAMPGAPQSAKVIALNGGRSRTKLP